MSARAPRACSITKVPDVDDEHPRPASRLRTARCSWSRRSLIDVRRRRARRPGAGSGCCCSSTRRSRCGRSPRTTSSDSSSATCCRRRSAATSCASPLRRRPIGSSEDAFGSVVLERLTGFVALPLLVFVGFALRPSLLDRAARVDRAARRRRSRSRVLGLILVRRRPPAPRGPLRRARELDALHRRRARGVDRLRRDPRQIVPRPRHRDRSTRLSVVAIVRADLPRARPAGPDRGRDRVRARGARCCRCSRSRSAGSACAKARSCCSCHGLRRQQPRRPRSPPGCCGTDACSS